MSMESPTEYEIATHKGRQLCERGGSGYCGSIGIRGHIDQMNDPKSWIHSFLDVWFLKFKQSINTAGFWNM